MMHHALREKEIEVELNIVEDSKIESYKNEYRQVLLNLISNAKDVLVQRGVLSPKITVTVEKMVISVADNGGGVEAKHINRIFEPYFTTKEEHSGIGLYMSKMIVEKRMEGKLTLENGDEGAIFLIRF